MIEQKPKPPPPPPVVQEQPKPKVEPEKKPVVTAAGGQAPAGAREGAEVS